MKNVWYKKYVKTLTSRVKVNTRALKISEKGVDMEEEKYPGLHLNEIRTYGDDVIIKIETLGLEPSAEILSLVRIDSGGLNLITADDPSFDTKLRDMLSDIDNKRVFLYHKEFTLQHLRMYLKIIPTHVVDLKELTMKGRRTPMFAGEKNSIVIPWDPILPSEVPEMWMNGETDMVKLHALAEALRLHLMYGDYIVRDAVKLPVDIAIKRGVSVIRRRRGHGRITLGPP